MIHVFGLIYDHKYHMLRFEYWISTQVSISEKKKQHNWFSNFSIWRKYCFLLSYSFMWLEMIEYGERHRINFSDFFHSKENNVFQKMAEIRNSSWKCILSIICWDGSPYELAVILTAPPSRVSLSYSSQTLLWFPSCKETGAIFTSTGSGKKVIYFSEQHFFFIFLISEGST